MSARVEAFFAQNATRLLFHSQQCRCSYARLTPSPITFVFLSVVIFHFSFVFTKTGCAPDTFGVKTGATSKPEGCESCPADRTTGAEKTGATSSLACACKRDLYFSRSTGGVSASPTPDNKTLRLLNGTVPAADFPDTCQDCPKGADCSTRDGVALQEIFARQGFWRSSLEVDVFVSCSEAYRGADAVSFGMQRCCPPGRCGPDASKFGLNGSNTSSLRRLSSTTSNTSNTSSLTSSSVAWSSDQQCASGYRGALCSVCADGFVKVGQSCRECDGGAQVGLAMLVTSGLCLVLFLALLIVMVKSKRDAADIASDGQGLFGHAKLVLTFVQICSVFPSVFSSVPWPSIYDGFVLNLAVANFDLVGLFSLSACALSISEMEKFIVHMLLVPMTLVSVAAAYKFAGLLTRGSPEKRSNQSEQLYKVYVFVLLLVSSDLAFWFFLLLQDKPPLTNFCILMLIRPTVSSTLESQTGPSKCCTAASSRVSREHVSSSILASPVLTGHTLLSRSPLSPRYFSLCSGFPPERY